MREEGSMVGSGNFLKQASANFFYKGPDSIYLGFLAT